MNPKHVASMIALVLVAVPIAFLNELNHLAALLLLNGSSFVNVFELHQLHALAMVFLNIHEHGLIIVEIFWGLWLLPFGWLVVKSGVFPKILGILLIIAGCGYVITSFTFLLFPHYGELVEQYAAVPEGIGEILMILWLLIMGAKDPKPAKTVTAD